jgi:hypothetical protein
MTNICLVKSREHADAIESRDRFLKAHPQLQDLQMEIDRKLRSAASNHNRLLIINQMMMKAFMEMDSKLQSFRSRSRQGRRAEPEAEDHPS